MRRFILFHNKCQAAEIGKREINQFLSHLAVHERGVCFQSEPSVMCDCLSPKACFEEAARPFRIFCLGKKPQTLPVILNRDEVKAVSGQLSGTHWLMTMVPYGAGL